MTTTIKTDKIVDRDYLESLSAEELQELIQVADHVEQAEAEEGNYIPNKVQESVHSSMAFIRALFSGNGVGKTTACIQEAKWTAYGTHPYRPTSRIPNTTIIVLDDSSKADTVYVTEIRKKRWFKLTDDMLYNHGRAYTQEIRFPNGSNIIFMTHEMADTKFESIQCGAIIFDEPPPRRIFVALLRGMREKGTKPWIMFAGTPLGRYAPWMYREIYRPWKFGEDPEIECFFGSTDDNMMNLEDGTIERQARRFTKQELETRRYGKFEFLQGCIFNTFRREHHVEKPFPWPRSWPCILAVDPHLRKNHVAVLIGIDPDKELHVLRELETSLAGRAAAEFFIRAVDGFWVRTAICDNFGSIELYGEQGTDARKSFIQIWNETAHKMGKGRLQLRATTKREKADDEWIEDMRDWLRLEYDLSGQERPRFHVFDTCVKVIDNFESYVWDEHTGRKADLQEPKEEPLGTNCDQLMCVKYAIATKPDRIGMDKVYSRRQVAGKAQEYESHGQAKPWLKD